MAATRAASRFISRRLSSGGKILSEEEKAVENVYIKKLEQEKLEKLARKGVKSEAPATSSDTATPAANAASGSAGSSTSRGVSTDKNRNYAVLAGTVTALAGLGWYLSTRDKKTEEAQD
ncbi:unnamed protein product [Spirodela intermedia]|uniref:Uncharacterized protein n=1 Tax=Spirodela intermedia TaxID=51605 RepID=A0A7I8KGV7_SPIIN|nr:unnamed protein product [Spirodela intermedia]